MGLESFMWLRKLITVGSYSCLVFSPNTHCKTTCHRAVIQHLSHLNEMLLLYYQHNSSVILKKKYLISNLEQKQYFFIYQLIYVPLPTILNFQVLTQFVKLSFQCGPACVAHCTVCADFCGSGSVSQHALWYCIQYCLMVY